MFRMKTISVCTFMILISSCWLNDLYAQDRNPNLLVFVGEIINIKRLPKTSEYQYIVDFAYSAKYKVIQVVLGEYHYDTIEFEAHDHYGIPSFSKYKNVLLYLSQDSNGKWIQQKYLYSAVYQTTEGRWAGPFDLQDYSDVKNKNINIKPEIIPFKDSIYLDIKWTLFYKPKISKKTRDMWYPSPYYLIRGDSALVKMGNYVEELILLKKNGVLEARGITW